MAGRRVPLVVAFVAAAVATGCTRTGGTSPAGDVAEARAELAHLPVTAPVNPGRYDRTRDFGPAWKDVDRDGCDTRNAILHRDLVDVTPATGCQVTSGTLHDPYTGRTIHWHRGPHSAAVQVDHVIPLHAAWQHGAASWPQGRRVAYANDPQVLLAVDGRTNTAKGDKTAGEWRPPSRREWCDYATRYIRIATRYRLSISRDDQVALAQMLGTCTGEAQS